MSAFSPRPDDEEILSHPHPSSVPVPVVSEDAGILTLHFQSDYIQSQMPLDDPDGLAFRYLRAMMAFELYRPSPEKIAMIGLGGGSMAKWCYRHHPNAHFTVVEINPHVIALRDTFQIPPDDDRFRIVCENGAKFVAEVSWEVDVLLVDGFGVDRVPPELCTQRFYDDCFQALTASGLMVVNVCEDDNREILSRIRKSFNDKVFLSPNNDGNGVVFACKGELPWPQDESPESFQMKVRKFEKKYGLGKAMAPLG